MDVVERWRANEPAQMKAAQMMAPWGFSQEETLEARARVLELVEPEPAAMLAACDMIEQFTNRGTSIGSTLALDARAARLAAAVANYAIAISWAEQGIEQDERPVSVLAGPDVNGARGVSASEEASVGEHMRGWGFADEEIQLALDMLLRLLPTPPEVADTVRHVITKSWGLGEKESGLVMSSMRTRNEQNVRRAEVLANYIAALAALRSGFTLSEPPFVILGSWKVPRD